MARSRNIKPSFFNNDVLAEIEPLGRILFIGLWTICDYKGNLEFREKKVKASLLPYDDCSVMDIAINLEQSGFIQSYSNDGVIYINIVNFEKHQNPHKNEKLKGSDTPSISCNGSQLYDLKECSIKSDKIAINPDDNGTNPADSFNLIPDSFNLIPDSSFLIPDSDATSRFSEFWDMYGKKVDSRKCESKFNKLTNAEVEIIFSKLPDYIKSTPDKQYRKNPLTWLNGKCWNDEIQLQMLGNQSAMHNLDDIQYESGSL